MCYISTILSFWLSLFENDLGSDLKNNFHITQHTMLHQQQLMLTTCLDCIKRPDGVTALDTCGFVQVPSIVFAPWQHHLGMHFLSTSVINKWDHSVWWHQGLNSKIGEVGIVILTTRAARGRVTLSRCTPLLEKGVMDLEVRTSLDHQSSLYFIECNKY